ncbi:MAG: single-stranded-DNA-specific exonuclease RecJ [Planctomycetota bacterium]|jgi:single-stranded-DNA-specific exonuclease
MTKKWILPPEKKDTVGRLATHLRIAEVTALLLANRGLTEPADAQRFLQPSLHELQDPCGHPPVTRAAAFLLEAARSGKRITIFGDYDADGICAAALLMRCFRYLGTDVDIYIPHRIEEGYGLNREALEEIAGNGTDVVVTVDCGISAFAEAARARELGMEMVITDHHEPGDRQPDAAHVLNPKLPDVGFGYANLAGVGVAFKLVWAMGQELSESHRVSEEFKDLLMEALSLVAVGTIADVVPLVEENRVLTHYGLQSLTAASRPGLRALIAASRVRGSSVSARDVAFRLAPRLNAAGRMGDARAAVELLTTSDERHAADLAEHLERQNRLRIKAQAATVEEAEDRLKQDEQLLKRNCIVLADPNWHQGVLGLVASRLAERHWRPAFVFGTNGDLACGSARSVPGFPLFSIVKECADLLERFGGHKGAAGLTLRLEKLPAFTERVNELAGRFFGLERPVPELLIDGEIELAALNPALVKELRLLEPFGKGNPAPVFAASGLLHVGNARIVGTTKSHLAFLVRQGRTTLRVIAMNKADWLDELRGRRGQTFSLAFEPRIDTYRGRMAVELRAEDLQWDAERAVERGA